MTGTAFSVSCSTPICSIWCIEVSISRLKAEAGSFYLSLREACQPLLELAHFEDSSFKFFQHRRRAEYCKFEGNVFGVMRFAASLASTRDQCFLSVCRCCPCFGVKFYGANIGNPTQSIYGTAFLSTKKKYAPSPEPIISARLDTKNSCLLACLWWRSCPLPQITVGLMELRSCQYLQSENFLFFWLVLNRYVSARETFCHGVTEEQCCEICQACCHWNYISP
jgi:hypothetical protein